MLFDKIKTPARLMQFMQKNLHYGFATKNKVYLDNYPDFQKDMNNFYKLSTPKRLLKTGYGVCWDFCELQRAFFKEKNIPHDCFFVHSFKNRAEGGPTHSFTLFYQNNRCFWFEFSWMSNQGIWQFDSKQQALKHIVALHKQSSNATQCKLYKISKPKANLNTFDYVEHCINCQELTIN